MSASVAEAEKLFTSVIIDAFASGEVNILENARGVRVELADGWSSRHVFDGNVREVFVAFAQGDSVLPMHNHHQLEQVYVVAGACAVRTGDTREECAAASPRRLAVGDGIILPGGVWHEFSGVGPGDTMLLVVFEPPVSTP